MASLAGTGGAAALNGALARGLKRAVRVLFGKGRWAGLLILIAMTGLRFADPQWVELVRLKLFDTYQVISPRPAAEMQVVVIDIDEDSLAVLGQWPWSRKLVGDMVVKVMEAGASIVGFDAVFAEPDRLSPGAYADSVPELAPDLVARLKELPDNDAYFADVLKETRAVLGLTGGIAQTTGNAPRPRQPAVAWRNEDPRPYLIRFPSVVGNLPVLEDAAVGRGLFSVSPETDGIIRRVPAIAMIDGAPNPFPALSIEMLRVLTESTTLLVRASAGIGVQDVVLPAAKVVIPTDPNGRLLPHFSAMNPKRYVSAKDVVSGKFDPAQFDGKLVLVGASAAGLRDIRATPIEDAVPGVEVHAQLLESILTETLLARPYWADTGEIIVTVGVGLIMLLGLALVGAKLTLVLFLGIAALLIGGSWYSFTQDRTLLDASFPVLSCFAIYLVLTYLSYVQEEAERQQVRSAFGLYLSPAMVERVAANPHALKLGGEMRSMTIMFCDLRGFTTISEMYDAEGLTTLINRYLTPMTTIIQDTGGTVDKYIGDAIMAFWNAPLDVPSHEKAAARALLGMRVGMAQLNVDLKAEAERDGTRYVPLAIGIGLNTGICCVGNMGSAQRLNYSVLGDAVNLAARLEGQSKTYHADNVIGEVTYEGMKDFACLELDLIQVKGKTVPVHVFNVVGDERMALEPDFVKLKDLHDRMIAAYRGQRWDEADDLMAAAVDLATKYNVVGVHEVYQERVADMRADPPPGDWDGVYVAKTK